MANLQNRLLWWTLMGSLVAYTAVAHVVEMAPEEPMDVDLLLALFVGLSLAVAVGSLAYRRRALAGPIASGALDPSTPGGQVRAFQPYILNLVLSESIGIYGLVLTFLSGDTVYALGFCIAAAVLLFLHRPTAPDLSPPSGGSRRGSDATPIA